MYIPTVLRPLVSTPQKRSVLLGLSAAYLLVQISSLPIALSLPSLADHFDTGVDDAAWIVIAYLVMVGSLVLLAARLGDRFGHINVFFAGMVIAFVASAPMALSQELWQIVIWRGLTGVGAALLMGNANAVLAAFFPPEQRGRAFSIPIIGARFGTLIGLALFALFLHFFSWRLVFAAYIPIGLVAMIVSWPMLKYRERNIVREGRGGVDWPGGVLLASAAIALVMSGTHVHGGEESFTSEEGLRYHLPMHGLFLVLLALFVFVETRVSNPVVAMNHFRQKYFSMSLASNVTYHFSMVATMTLVPIVVEEGFGRSPLYVPIVLLAEPGAWPLRSGHRGVDIRPVPAPVPAARHDDPHRGRVPHAGPVGPARHLLDAASADAADIDRHQHVQPDQQRHGNELAAAGAPRRGVGDAGDDQGDGPRPGRHRRRERAGSLPAGRYRGALRRGGRALLHPGLPRGQPDGRVHFDGRSVVRLLPQGVARAADVEPGAPGQLRDLTVPTVKTSDFDYRLPDELIAQTPAEPARPLAAARAVSRHRPDRAPPLLRPDRAWLQAGDVMVFNDSRVFPARLHGRKTDTGAKVELLLLHRQRPSTWKALVRPGRRMRVGAAFEVASADGTSVSGEVIEVEPDGSRIVRLSDEDRAQRLGVVPLPPYIREPLADAERYQTVYSRITGSVAAPTAGLHFTEALLDRIREIGVETVFVTLHVGWDSFRPVQHEDPSRHELHSEHWDLSPEAALAINRAKSEGRRVVSVGTTAVRLLEHAATLGGDPLRAGSGWADLMILPGHRLPGGRRARNELPPAPIDASDAHVSLRGPRSRTERLPRGRPPSVQVLQLRGRHADSVGDPIETPFVRHLRHLCDICATLVRHLRDTYATPVRHLCDTDS